MVDQIGAGIVFALCVMGILVCLCGVGIAVAGIIETFRH